MMYVTDNFYHWYFRTNPTNNDDGTAQRRPPIGVTVARLMPPASCLFQASSRWQRYSISWKI